MNSCETVERDRQPRRAIDRRHSTPAKIGGPHWAAGCRRAQYVCAWSERVKDVINGEDDGSVGSEAGGLG